MRWEQRHDALGARWARALVLATLLALIGLDAPPAMAVDCAGLSGLKIPASAIGLPTTGGEVTSTSAKTSNSVAYCDASAALHPVDPQAPDIKLEIGLPDNWQGDTMMFGGGGYNGTVPSVTDYGPWGAGTVPLERGMVVYGSDSGHAQQPDSVPSLDGSFGLNDEALRNFAGDALKKTHDATMFVISRYYGGRTPRHSYFAGGSTGGREALAVAQKWPEGFDGVISAYPAYNAATLDLFFGYEARELAPLGAYPDSAQQKLIYDSVIQACDGLDGATDGLVSDVKDCHFDPETLRCPNGVNLFVGCLSDGQIAAVKALSSPLRLGYRTGSGTTGYPGFPFLSGANMTDVLVGFGEAQPMNPMPKVTGYGPQFWEQWVRYFVTRDPNYDSLSLDPAAPGRWEQRIDELTKMQDFNNPDLRAFARRGGKLILMHGLADPIVSPDSTVDYYKDVVAEMGPGATRKFLRFYTAPGAGHANISGAFAVAWDSISALQDWVEHGNPPKNPIVSDGIFSHNSRTRPLCEYPSWPRYVAGSIDDAASYVCASNSPDADR